MYTYFTHVYTYLHTYYTYMCLHWTSFVTNLSNHSHVRLLRRMIARIYVQIISLSVFSSFLSGGAVKVDSAWKELQRNRCQSAGTVCQLGSSDSSESQTRRLGASESHGQTPSQADLKGYLPRLPRRQRHTAVAASHCRSRRLDSKLSKDSEIWQGYATDQLSPAVVSPRPL